MDNIGIKPNMLTSHYERDWTLLWHHRLGNLHPKSMKASQLHKVMEDIPTAAVNMIPANSGYSYEIRKLDRKKISLCKEMMYDILESKTYHYGRSFEYLESKTYHYGYRTEARSPYSKNVTYPSWNRDWYLLACWPKKGTIVMKIQSHQEKIMCNKGY